MTDTGAHAPLCEDCRTQIFRTYPSERWDMSRTLSQQGLSPRWYAIQSVASINRKSSVEQCFICRGRDEGSKSFSLELSRSASTSGIDSIGRPHFVLSIGDAMWIRSRWGLFDTGQDSHLYLLGAATLVSAMDEPESHVEAFSDAAAKRRRAEATGSERCIKLASKWLNACCQSHQSCKSLRKDTHLRWYPTRLLSLHGLVGEEIIARLIETNEEAPEGEYATLSHCWGASKFETLTKDNLTDFKSKGRSVLSLLPTFRHAINVTMELGLRYLWIDCFCILQGSDEASSADWHRESAQMKEVYRNSFVNLGATAGKDPTNGLFTRLDFRSPSRIIEWKPSTTAQRKEYRVIPMDESLAIQPQSKLFAENLFDRAWIIQERLLTARMLHFGSGYLAWECAETPFASNRFPAGLDGQSSMKFAGLRPGLLAGNTDLDTDELYRQWSSILILYTKSQLSQPSKDKLFAVQGLGDLVAERSHDRYHDGFLQSTLPKALCWQAYASRSQRARDRDLPSWNWASMDGPLDFDTELHIQSSGEQLCVAMSDTGAGRIFDRDRLMVCIGRLFKVRLSTEQPYTIGIRTKTAIVEFESRQGTAMYDDMDECRRSVAVGGLHYILPIFATRPRLHSKRMQHGFLFLWKTKRGTYRRLGLFNPYKISGETKEDLQNALAKQYMETKASVIILE